MIYFQNIPNKSTPTSLNLLKSRVDIAFQKFLDENKIANTDIRIDFSNELNEENKKEYGKKEAPSEERIQNYHSQKPSYEFDQLIIPDNVKEELISALELINLREKVFEEWGLCEIEPNPRIALNFHGHPGTGKTLAAHAIASKIGCNIMIASYANIESMYHGEGPKNVVALFQAAEKENALLFIDEADSLLSKRLTNVTQGSEQAINSMRSQLLICLENFKGVVLFATNLVANYDKAFETRVKNIYFPLPDFSCRKRIWEKHLVKKLPLADDVILNELALIDNICGRDIKNSVIQAAIRAKHYNSTSVKMNDLVICINRIKDSRIKQNNDTEERMLTNEELKMFQDIDFEKIKNNN